MLIGYARVSKYDQNIDRQTDELQKHGCDRIYFEKMTGTKAQRPELENLMNFARAGDTVIVCELSRLSRSTKDLFSIIGQLNEKNINIKSLKECWIDTTTPQGTLLFTIFAGLSQFERDLISQRTKEGLKAAKARGRLGGRPKKRTEKAVIVKALCKDGVKIVDIVKQTGLSRSTVNRIIHEIYLC